MTSPVPRSRTCTVKQTDGVRVSAVARGVYCLITLSRTTSPGSREATRVPAVQGSLAVLQKTAPRTGNTLTRKEMGFSPYPMNGMGAQPKYSMATREQWHELAQQLRVDSIRCTTAAGSGHPTSSMSAADLMAVLLYEHLHYDFQDPKNPDNDHLIFSKGHAAPLLYSVYKAAGAISDQELLSLRKFGSLLEGHPVPLLPYVDVATGSLGQGLPIGVGMGLAGKYLDKLPYRVWAVLGDSEMSEGSIYEALELAGHYGLSNLIAILDMNRLGQRGETMLGWNGAAYAARARAFGWHPIEIDGHDLDEIESAYVEAEHHDQSPTLIIARALKGKGFSEIENKNGWHGKALPPDMAERAIKELGGERHIIVDVAKPR